MMTVPTRALGRRRYLEENVAATQVGPDAVDLERLASLEPAGDRYADMAGVPGDSKERAR